MNFMPQVAKPEGGSVEVQLGAASVVEPLMGESDFHGEFWRPWTAILPENSKGRLKNAVGFSDDWRQRTRRIGLAEETLLAKRLEKTANYCTDSANCSPQLA
jgi:hypothetical protein